MLLTAGPLCKFHAYDICHTVASSDMLADKLKGKWNGLSMHCILC